MLYGTAGCHLCEQAEHLLAESGARWRIVDIADDEELSQHYGLRIPVLSCEISGAELNWPFELSDIRRFAAVPPEDLPRTRSK